MSCTDLMPKVDVQTIGLLFSNYIIKVKFHVLTLCMLVILHAFADVC